MQTNPAVGQNKNVKWSENPCIQSGIVTKGLIQQKYDAN